MSKNNLVVGFVVRGWPLADFPSGIITYVNNLIGGFDNKIDTYILAHHTLNKVNNDHVLDLSTIEYKRSFTEILRDATSYRLNHHFFQALRYESLYSKSSKRIALGLHRLPKTPDIVEIEESFGLASWLVTQTDVPVVVRLHGPWFVAGNTINLKQDIEYQSRVTKEGLAIKNAFGLTSPSLYVLNRVREFYNLELPHAQVIPNPVPQVSENMRWQGLEQNSKSILFVGRFDLTKGGDIMLDAFRLIALKNPDLELTFVGPDWGVIKNDKKYLFMDYVENFIPENHIKKRIRSLGHRNAEQIAQLRKNSLITVIPSRHETFCVSLLEALAAGCPVVAAKSAAIEIVTDGYNGSLSESESSESIAEKILCLIDNPTLMKQFSVNALADCENKYKPELIADQTVNYYQSVLNLS